MASAAHVTTVLPTQVVVHKDLVEGGKFLKWTEQEASNAAPVTLKVDRNGFFILWYSDQKKEMRHLDISHVRDIRTGKGVKVPKDPKLREMLSLGPGELEDKTVTIVYSTDFVNVNFFNFCTRKADVAKVWVTEMMKVLQSSHAVSLSPIQSLEKIFTLIKLMANSNGKVPVKSIVKLFVASHKDDRRLVEKALDSAGLPSHKNDEINAAKLEFQDFFNFYFHLVHRKEIRSAFSENCKSESTKNVMTISEFMKFVDGQRDSRLNEILFPFCNSEKAQELIAKYEPNQFNVKRKQLSYEGFLRYLFSDENQIVSSEVTQVHEDMGQPLSSYYIQSSHNTYLTGHQWTGKSSVEMYRQVLLSGCRCIELDLWDGKTKEEEPVILHGYTLVPEISAKDVIMAIADSAFKTSEYPVILSFENHCKPRQQDKIALYCREYFGDMLLTDPLEQYPLERNVALPPPEALKGKIIIKNKKKHVEKPMGEHALNAAPPSAAPRLAPQIATSAADGRSVSAAASGRIMLNEPAVNDLDESGDSDSDEEAAVPAKDVVAAAATSGGKHAGAVEEVNKRAKETKAAEAVSRLVNYVAAVRFHGFEHAERKGRSFEMSSFDETNAVSNLLRENPVEFVKYNRRQLSRIFPKGTRVDSTNFMPHVFWNAGCQLVALNYQTLDLAMQLNLGFFEYNGRCGYMPKPDFMCRDDRSFDPFTDTPVDGIIPGVVSVQILSGQFLTDRRVGTYVDVEMFGLPCDTVRRKFRTAVVPNNGINPQYSDDPFLFKQVVLPDLAVLRVAAYEDSGKFIGHHVLPVKGIRPGFRHIGLRNESFQRLLLPMVFVHITVQDYVPDRFTDLAEALADPIRYQSEQEKRDIQLRVLTDEDEVNENHGLGPASSADNGPASPLPPRRLRPSQGSQGGPLGTLSKGDGDPSSVDVDGGDLRTGTSSEPSGSAGGSGASTLVREEIAATSKSGTTAATTDELAALVMSHKSVIDKLRERDKKISHFLRRCEKEETKIRSSLFNKEEKVLKAKSKSAPKVATAVFSKILPDRDSTDKEPPSPREIEEKLSGVRQDHQEKLDALGREQAKTEQDLVDKYRDIVIAAAEKHLKFIHQSSLKHMEEQHAKDCSNTYKNLEKKASEQLKSPRESGDREEINRLKKEKRSFIVKRCVEERRKLDESHKMRVEMEGKKIEEVRKSLPAEVDRRVPTLSKDASSISVSSN